MSYEVYKVTRTRRGEASMRVDTKNNRIGLTVTARKMLPKACTHVLIAFDREARTVALLPTMPSDPAAVPLSKQGTIGMGAFATDFRIPPGKYKLHTRKIKDLPALESDPIKEEEK